MQIRDGGLILPPSGKFRIGDPVQKANGYKWPGVVVSVFSTTEDKLRYTVECVAPDVKGALHIFNEDQLEPRDPATTSINDVTERLLRLVDTYAGEGFDDATALMESLFSRYGVDNADSPLEALIVTLFGASTAVEQQTSIAISLSRFQRALMNAFMNLDREIYLNFKRIAAILSSAGHVFSTNDLRTAAQELEENGLLVYGKGLATEQGEVVGSGYALTKLGEQYLNQ